jgi:hypothetical protein
MPDFNIVTRGMPSRAEEWFQAQGAPISELPELTEVERHRARITLRTDEQYARHLMLRAFTRKREEREAEILGNTIAAILQEFGGEFQLKSIGKRGLEPGWLAQILFCPRGSVDGVRSISFPTEDFSGEAGRQVLNILSPEEIRAHLVTKLDLGEGQRMAS